MHTNHDSESEIYNDELNLSFLEVIEQREDFFAVTENFYHALSDLGPAPVSFPSLHHSVFEEPIAHAVWSGSWPQTQRHFPA